MKTSDIVRILSETEDLLSLHGANSFRSRAYGRAARALKSSGLDLIEAVREERPIEIEGIGKGLEAEIRQIVLSGTSSQYEELLEKTPPGLIDVLRIRGLGAKKVKSLWSELAVESLEDLEEAASDGRVASLKGFGAKTEQKILEEIGRIREAQGKFRLNAALQASDDLLEVLRGSGAVERAEVTGRARRGAEEFTCIALLVATDDPRKLFSYLDEESDVADLTFSDEAITGVAPGGVPVKVITVPPADFHWRLHQTTGSSDYLFMIEIPLKEKGYEIGDDGLHKDGEPVDLRSEDEIFSLAEMQVIPPELREGIDEVRSALDRTIPELITRDDLKGLVHSHSIWSDGRNSVEELAERASADGYRYLLLTDHSKAAFYANGLDEKRLEEQGKEIDEVNKRYDPEKFTLLKGIECDILRDGSLDLDEGALAALDAVIISVHSLFNLSEEEQTDRVCRALEHRYASILAHPTGRLILSREGYRIDLKRVIKAAAEQGKILEHNCNPHRLDLSWRMLRYARRLGVPVAIDPDAHAVAEFESLRYGIMMARKAMLSADEVVNTRDARGFMKEIKKTRGEAD